MLIRLSLQEGEIGNLSALEVGALENIGLSAFHGYHMVISSRRVLARLERDTRISTRARAAFRKVLSKASEIDSIERTVAVRVDVSLDQPAVVLNGNVWSVPLLEFSNAFVLSVPVILCENIVDANYYLQLGRWYGWHSRVRSLKFMCVPMGGGGNTTAGELNQAANIHPRFVVCIVDSDRDSPGGPVGATAEACINILPESRWYARLHVLDEREIENTIPVSWLRMTQTGKQTGAALDELAFLDDTNMQSFRRHTDLKTGFTSCQLVASAVESLREIAKAELRKGAIRRPRLRHCADGMCVIGQPCFEVLGLGPTLPNQVVRWLEEARSEDTRDVVSDVVLAPLAKLVFEWGAAGEKIRV